MTDRMTAKEAERRLDSALTCGGTPEQRAFALTLWKAALMREYAEKHSTDNRETAKALSGA